MPWHDDDNHPFAGIAKKLERADENIVNLHREILGFFAESKHPIIPKPHTQGWQEALDYHRTLALPKRFGVLSGEIVHHLRSCLDHIVWHFSTPESRRDHPEALEFPVFREPPLTKDELRRYKRKIQGITSPNVLALIDGFQPHLRGANAANDLICIIHDMDRFDKHRELVIVTSCANLTFPPGTSLEVIANVLKYRQGKTMSAAELSIAQRTVKNDAEVRPQIAFAQFGNRDTQFVVPSLMQLLNAVDDAVGMFAIEV
jgi:hypothetical protein